MARRQPAAIVTTAGVAATAFGSGGSGAVGYRQHQRGWRRRARRGCHRDGVFLMASLAQIYAFTFGNPDFKQRFAAARMQAAWDIIGETPQVPERREWAKKIFASPSSRS
jgi:hypothetical protein